MQNSLDFSQRKIQNQIKTSLQTFLGGVRNVSIWFDFLPIHFTEKSVIAQPIFIFEKREQTFKVRSNYFYLILLWKRKFYFKEASYTKMWWVHRFILFFTRRVGLRIIHVVEIYRHQFGWNGNPRPYLEAMTNMLLLPR
jgi:hypothetical protein